MVDHEISEILIKQLKFTEAKVAKINLFLDDLIKYNKKYNLISKNSEIHAWRRHVLDSAQIVKFVDFSKNGSLADLGSGAGFPGIIMSIFNDNPSFHVKLYEKSRIKCQFLKEIKDRYDIKAIIYEDDIKNQSIEANYVVCRAFKKLPEIIRISREILDKPYKLIILKGKNAQEELNKASKEIVYEYRLEKSISDVNSRIIIMNVR